MTDFRQVLELFAEEGIESIVIGGAAAIAHGVARLTLDIDFVYRRTPENLQRIVKVLGPLSPYPRGAPPGLPFIWDRRTLEMGLNFTLTTTLGDIDLLGEIIGGGNYEDLLPHTVPLNVFGVVFPCLDLDPLIQVKRAAGRPKDFEAIAELEALREEKARAQERGAGERG